MFRAVARYFRRCLCRRRLSEDQRLAGWQRIVARVLSKAKRISSMRDFVLAGLVCKCHKARQRGLWPAKVKGKKGKGLVRRQRCGDSDDDLTMFE